MAGRANRLLLTFPILLAASASAEVPANAWLEKLTLRQQDEFRRGSSELQKHAKHEEFYARRDGKHELEETQREYARKEALLVGDFRRKAASAGAKHDSSVRNGADDVISAADSGPEAPLLALAPDLTERTAAEKAHVEKKQDAEKKQEDKSEAEKTLEGQKKAAKTEEEGQKQVDWQQRLSRQQREELHQRMSELQKHAKHEEFYASKDGKHELEEMQREYARKEALLVGDFRRKAASAGAKHDSAVRNGADDVISAADSGPEAPLLALAPVLTERTKAEKATVEKKQDAEKKQEDKGEAEKTLEGQKKGAKTEEEGEKEDHWQQRLSRQQREEMQQRLQRLRREEGIQMSYAAEYGPAATRDLHRAYVRKRAKIMARFNKLAAESRSTSLASGFPGPALSMIPTMLSFVATLLVLVSAAALVRRRLHPLPAHLEPLLLHA